MNRKQFEEHLNQIFNAFDEIPLYKAVEYIAMQDEWGMAYLKSAILEKRKKIQYYLDAYDSAETEEKIKKVIGSVRL